MMIIVFPENTMMGEISHVFPREHNDLGETQKETLALSHGKICHETQRDIPKKQCVPKKEKNLGTQ